MYHSMEKQDSVLLLPTPWYCQRMRHSWGRVPEEKSKEIIGHRSTSFHQRNTLRASLCGGGGVVTKPCLTHMTPWTVAHQDPCPWNSPGKNTGVGCHSLLQGIFPTQGSNLDLLHCSQNLYRLSYEGSPKGSSTNATHLGEALCLSFESVNTTRVMAVSMCI